MVEDRTENLEMARSRSAFEGLEKRVAQGCHHERPRCFDHRTQTTCRSELRGRRWILASDQIFIKKWSTSQAVITAC